MDSRFPVVRRAGQLEPLCYTGVFIWGKYYWLEPSLPGRIFSTRYWCHTYSSYQEFSSRPISAVGNHNRQEPEPGPYCLPSCCTASVCGNGYGQHCPTAWRDILFVLLRGAIVNRTYSKHKNLDIYLFLLTIFTMVPRNKMPV